MTASDWILEDFLTRFDQWVERDAPTDDARFFVLEWIHSLQSDPYAHAVRKLDIGIDWWFTEIVNASTDTHAVVSFYRVNLARRVVRCDSIATLLRPFSSDL